MLTLTYYQIKERVENTLLCPFLHQSYKNHHLPLLHLYYKDDLLVSDRKGVGIRRKHMIE